MDGDENFQAKRASRVQFKSYTAFTESKLQLLKKKLDQSEERERYIIQTTLNLFEKEILEFEAFLDKEIDSRDEYFTVEEANDELFNTIEEENQFIISMVIDRTKEVHTGEPDWHIIYKTINPELTIEEDAVMHYKEKIYGWRCLMNLYKTFEYIPVQAFHITGVLQPSTIGLKPMDRHLMEWLVWRETQNMNGGILFKNHSEYIELIVKALKRDAIQRDINPNISIDLEVSDESDSESDKELKDAKRPSMASEKSKDKEGDSRRGTEKLLHQLKRKDSSKAIMDLKEMERERERERKREEEQLKLDQEEMQRERDNERQQELERKKELERQKELERKQEWQRAQENIRAREQANDNNMFTFEPNRRRVPRKCHCAPTADAACQTEGTYDSQYYVAPPIAPTMTPAPPQIQEISDPSSTESLKTRSVMPSNFKKSRASVYWNPTGQGSDSSMISNLDTLGLKKRTSRPSKMLQSTDFEADSLSAFDAYEAGVLVLCRPSKFQYWEAEMKNKFKYIVYNPAEEEEWAQDEICKYECVITSISKIAEEYKLFGHFHAVMWFRIFIDADDIEEAAQDYEAICMLNYFAGYLVTSQKKESIKIDDLYTFFKFLHWPAWNFDRMWYMYKSHHEFLENQIRCALEPLFFRLNPLVEHTMDPYDFDPNSA